MAVALVLVKLELALLAASLRTSGASGIVGFLVAVVLALGVGGIGGVLFAVTRAVDDQAAMEAAVGGMAIVLLIWMLGPLLTSSSGSTLDVDKLALLPLSPRQMMPGLLGGAVIGIGGLATMLTLGGAFIGLAPASPLAVLTALALLLQLATCATFGRLVSTAVSGATRSRRWRDIVLFAGPVLALTINVLAQLALRRTVPDHGTGFGPGTPGSPGAPGSPGEVTPLEDNPLMRGLLLLARLLPSGPAAMATGFARGGDTLRAVAALVAAVLVLFAGLALWHAALERTLTSASGASAGARRRRGARPRDLYPVWVTALLPRSRLGAVAAKELRLTWRDPRQRMAMVSSLFIVAMPLLSVGGIGSRSAAVVLFAAMPAYSFTLTSMNLFGFDGTAHWANVAAGDDVRSDILGKWLARVVLIVPLVAVLAAVLVGRAGSARFLLPALALAAASAGTSLGLGAVLSVRLPFPMPASRTNLFSSGTAGRGAMATVASMATFTVQAVLLGPLVLAAALWGDAAGVLVAVTVLGVAIGAAVAVFGLRSAVQWSAPRQPELLLALEPKQA